MKVGAKIMIDESEYGEIEERWERGKEKQKREKIESGQRKRTENF